MEHVVFFPGPDGSPAFRRTSSLEDAVRFVEHLRNSEGVAEVSVHALSEVPLAFRAYYRVEMPGNGYPPVAAPVHPQEPVVVGPSPTEARLTDPPVVVGFAEATALVPDLPAVDAPPAEQADGDALQWAEAAADERVASTFEMPEPIDASALSDVAAAAADVVPTPAPSGAGAHRSLGFFAH